MTFPGLLKFCPIKSPLGGVGQICLDSDRSQINPLMRGKFGRGPVVVSKKRGHCRPRHKGTNNGNDSEPFIMPPSLHFMIWLRLIDSESFLFNLYTFYTHVKTCM